MIREPGKGGFGERVPVGPFVEWIERQLALLEQIKTLSCPTTGEVPAMQLLADRLETTSRTLFRYREGRVAGYRPDGSKGDIPSETFPRAPVEDMLDSAGVAFEDVYPQIAEAEDVELEPDRFCETCDEIVTPLGGHCPWCDACLTPDAKPRPEWQCEVPGCPRSARRGRLCTAHRTAKWHRVAA